MTFLRSLFLNFLVVFFVNSAIPGVHVALFQDVPNLGADVLFSAIVGLLNASVFPFFFILELKPTALKMLILNGVISFGSYFAIWLMPFGVQVMPLGIFLGGGIVWIVSSLSSYLELKHTFEKT